MDPWLPINTITNHSITPPYHAWRDEIPNSSKLPPNNNAIRSFCAKFWFKCRRRKHINPHLPFQSIEKKTKNLKKNQVENLLLMFCQLSSKELDSYHLDAISCLFDARLRQKNFTSITRLSSPESGPRQSTKLYTRPAGSLLIGWAGFHRCMFVERKGLRSQTDQQQVAFQAWDTPAPSSSWLSALETCSILV